MEMSSQTFSEMGVMGLTLGHNVKELPCHVFHASCLTDLTVASVELNGFSKNSAAEINWHKTVPMCSL